MTRFQDPTLEELLADPVIRLVMRRDGFTGAQVRRIAHDARKRLAVPDSLPRRPAFARSSWPIGAGHEAESHCR